MRHALSCILLLVSASGCSEVEFRRGMPELNRPQDAALIAGTEGWADLDRGRRARIAGRLDDAVHDLEPLAERGYVDAMLALAATRGLQNGETARSSSIRWYRAALGKRPEALVPLSRALGRGGLESEVQEAERLLHRRIDQRDDPQATAALLDLYAIYPALDRRRMAPAIAERAGRSPVPALRLAAIGWQRDAVVDRASAERLIALCRRDLAIAPDCQVDLVAYHRYRGDRAALARSVDAALLAFAQFTPLTEADSLDRLPVDLAHSAGRLAAMLVEQDDVDSVAEQREEQQLAGVTATLLRNAFGEASIGAAIDADAAPMAMLRISTAAAPSAAVPPHPALGAAATGQAEPELANRVLRWMLLRGPTMRVEAAGVAVAYPYLLPDVNLAELLQAGVADGNPRASLLLGELYFFDQRQPREAALAELNLRQALGNPLTRMSAHYRLGRLYQQGYLGSPDPARSLDNFLTAARGRVSAADQHLARLFYNSPGTRVNRVNAWVFARLAEDSGYPVEVHSLRAGVAERYDLLQRLSADLTAPELARAQALYQHERRVHMVTQRIPGQRVWATGAAP